MMSEVQESLADLKVRVCLDNFRALGLYTDICVYIYICVYVFEFWYIYWDKLCMEDWG